MKKRLTVVNVMTQEITEGEDKGKWVMDLRVQCEDVSKMESYMAGTFAELFYGLPLAIDKLCK